jgi:hypothetical protein
MPACGHQEAVCIIGDFWTCKVGGRKNGPAVQSTGAFERLRERAWKQSEVEKALRDQFYQLSFPFPDDWDDGQKTPVVPFDGGDP